MNVFGEDSHEVVKDGPVLNTPSTSPEQQKRVNLYKRLLDKDRTPRRKIFYVVVAFLIATAACSRYFTPDGSPTSTFFGVPVWFWVIGIVAIAIVAARKYKRDYYSSDALGKTAVVAMALALASLLIVLWPWLTRLFVVRPQEAQTSIATPAAPASKPPAPSTNIQIVPLYALRADLDATKLKLQNNLDNINPRLETVEGKVAAIESKIVASVRQAPIRSSTPARPVVTKTSQRSKCSSPEIREVNGFKFAVIACG